MLFVSLFTLKPTVKFADALEKRIKWEEPGGIKPIAEYWLMTGTPNVISIDEADDIASIMASTMPWSDLFDIDVIPAVTAEEGLKLASQMMSKT